MARLADQARLDQIKQAIIENPEKKAGWLAQLLRLDNKTMQRALLQLEARGDLLIEDDHGQLSWFGKKW